MRGRAIIAAIAFCIVLVYSSGVSLVDAVVTGLFYHNDGPFVAGDTTLRIRSSEQEFWAFFEIQDNRFGRRWIPFCFSNNPRDKLKHVVLNGHSAIVSAARPNAILYYCTSRDQAYPFSIFNVPGVSRPPLPPGYVYEYDVRNPYEFATLCGFAGGGPISHPLRVVIEHELYAERYPQKPKTPSPAGD